MSFNKLLNNSQGVALMMVLTAIVLLSTIMLSFSLDSTVNKIRTYNIEDKSQAKLTAESGVRFAMARLKLYKDGFNYIQNNDGLQKVAKPEILNTLWNFPFVYPIPITQGMNQIQKTAIESFQENTLLSGSMRLTITNLSNKLNINAIRVALFNQEDEETEVDADGNPVEKEKPNADYNIETQLFRNFQNAFEKKSESDEDFYAQYSGVEPQELIAVLKTFVSDEDTLDNTGSVRGLFTNAEITPKHAPLGSMSEMYSLPGWDDDLVELINNEFTVHGAIMVDLNKITDNMLRLLIPRITDQEIKEFFEYKNDPEDPKFFNTIDDFKKYITNIGNIMGAEEFDNLVKEFELNNIKFGASPSLFKILSVGEKGRATYTLEAYVIIPAKPTYKKPQEVEENTNDGDDVNPNDPNKPDPNKENPNKTEPNKPDEKAKTFLLNPRIVEIYAK